MFLKSNRPFNFIRGMADSVSTGYDKAIDGAAAVLNRGNQNLLRGRTNLNNQRYNDSLANAAKLIRSRQEAGHLDKVGAAQEAIHSGNVLRQDRARANDLAHQKYMDSVRRVNNAGDYMKSTAGRGLVVAGAGVGVAGLGMYATSE